MDKGQKIRLQINDMTTDGSGVGRSEDGLTVFVKGALPGDTVQAEIFRVKKRYALARLLSIDEPSEDRTEGFCSLDSRCGGCPMGRLTYDAQLRLKERHVRDALTRIAGLRDPLIRPALEAESPWRYRNKASMAVSTGGIITRKGGIVENLGEPAVGFYRGKSREVTDCPDCALQTEPAAAAAEALREFMRQDHITGYDPRWEKGLMRHMVVRTAFGTGEVMVILVINGKGIPHAAKLVAMLDEAVEEPFSLESVILNINKGKPGEIFGDKTEVLAGRPTINEELGGMRYEISPLSFYQVNPAQMVKLYNKAAEYAALTGGETVLDLYCGAGTIGQWLLNELRSRDGEAFAGTKVIGIESQKSAVLDANRNAVINGIVNARYVCGKAEFVLPRLMGNSGDTADFAASAPVDEDLRVTKADVVILDPPRAGCDERLLDAVTAAEPSRIVYISCDPATLARDVKYLNGKGYRFMEATPADLFCWTGHVECVVLMSKVK